jgi:3-deoxy-D-manno-octulosonic-acid transferase
LEKQKIPHQLSHIQPYSSTKIPFAIKLAFLAYGLAWRVAIPFLRRNHRLQEGFEQRTLRTTLAAADLWIQAASVGEAFLAQEIIYKFRPKVPLRILITSGTRQGMDILETLTTTTAQHDTQLTIHTAYLPFDLPNLMDKALTAVRPRLMLLLESELWPGLLHNCQKLHIPVLVANGRMTAKSLARYLFWPALWRHLRPHRILAISNDDASRFATLFGKEIVETVPNIKFDRIANYNLKERDNPLRHLFPPNPRLIVLGSIRQEEEEDIGKMIASIAKAEKQSGQHTTIALFPRHMHRIESWKKFLDMLGQPWHSRSRITETIQSGSIILWDTMGEMLWAYQLARAAFVGGSLAPVGGQNFLEPLACGITPVIGPHWRNFWWVGTEIIEQQLVVQVNNWQEAANTLIQQCATLPDREQTRQKLVAYIQTRQGGTLKTCAIINELLT